MSRQAIFNEIEVERLYQQQKHGVDFDDKNTINDWSSCVTTQISGALSTQPTIVDDGVLARQRKQLLKTAIVCVAAIEAFDRNQGFPLRHYDSLPNKTE